jgi:hypothetical protein
MTKNTASALMKIFQHSAFPAEMKTFPKIVLLATSATKFQYMGKNSH